MTTTGPLCSLTRATSHANSSSEYLIWTSRVQWLPGSTIGFESSAMNRTQPSAVVEAVVEPVAADRQSGRGAPVLDAVDSCRCVRGCRRPGSTRTRDDERLVDLEEALPVRREASVLHQVAGVDHRRDPSVRVRSANRSSPASR